MLKRYATLQSITEAKFSLNDKIFKAIEEIQDEIKSKIEDKCHNLEIDLKK